MSYLRQLNQNIKCLLNFKNPLIESICKSSVHLSAIHMKEGDRRSVLKNLPKPDEGAQGERRYEIGYSGYEKFCDFPTPETPNRLFDEIPYKDIPVLHIKTTKNNTIYSLCAKDGSFIWSRSCGMEGFKNCRKGTNVAAQVTALAMAQKAIRLGYKTVRICIKGLGPGRMASIKGLQMGGMNIISITDNTPICEPPRARPPAARSV